VPQGAAAAGAGTERQGPARAAPVAATRAPGETVPWWVRWWPPKGAMKEWFSYGLW